VAQALLPAAHENRHHRLFLASLSLAAAQPNPAAAAARHWRESHERAILSELMELLAIPNLANDESNIRLNANAVAHLMERRGIKSRMLETAGSPPVVYGEIRTPEATRTLVFYAHYDGQPVDPKEWATPPWQPILRDRPLDEGGSVVPLPDAGPVQPEWRLYARSSSDDKAAIVAVLAALDGLTSANVSLHSNLKFVFEGEEELGSPHRPPEPKEDREERQHHQRRRDFDQDKPLQSCDPIHRCAHRRNREDPPPRNAPDQSRACRRQADLRPVQPQSA
jgi:hypothetical protein